MAEQTDNTHSTKRMSSRALRRLKKTSLEDELAKYQKPAAEELENCTDESDEEEVVATRKPTNAFAFLNDDDEDDSGSDDESDSEDGAADEDIYEEKNVRSTQSKNQGKPKNVKKDGSKSKNVDDIDDDELDQFLAQVKLEDKNKRRNGDESELSVSGEESNDYEEEEEDEVDVSEKLPPWPIYTAGGKLLTPKRYHRCYKLLMFDSRYLNPDTEYENLFGKLSAAAMDDADSSTSTSVSPEILSQIKKLAKRVRGWSGRDHRSIPGTTRKLKLTKIRDDWLPTPKKPLNMEEMTQQDVLNLNSSKYKNDWKDILLGDIKKEQKYGITYYNVKPGPTFSIPAVTEFFLSVVVQPDHESLINSLQKSPYSIETILQAACVFLRQGDKLHSSALVERALFVFDWSLPNNFQLGDAKSRLPYEFFLNRQIYLTVFRYITVLTPKSVFYTALSYCKLLLSFDPADDPLGVRYFIDYYAFMADEFQYLIDFVNSPLCQSYEEWLTAPLLYTVSLCYFKLGQLAEAKEAIENAYQRHPYTGHALLEKLGDHSHPWLLRDVNDTVKITTAVCLTRVESMLTENSVKNFLVQELINVIETVGKPNLDAYYWNNLEKIPDNLLRHAVLSGESIVIGKIPESFWNDNDIYEFDVLPPSIGTTIYDYVDDNQVSSGVIENTMRAEEIRQFEDLLNQRVVEERQ